jgi:hypothetical protein
LFRLFVGRRPLRRPPRRDRRGDRPAIAAVRRPAYDCRSAPSFHAGERPGHSAAIGALGEFAIGSHVAERSQANFRATLRRRACGALPHRIADCGMSPARHLDCRGWGSGRARLATTSDASGWSFGAALFPRRCRSGWPLRRDRQRPWAGDCSPRPRDRPSDDRGSAVDARPRVWVSLGRDTDHSTLDRP